MLHISKVIKEVLKNFFCIDFNFRDDEILINPIQNYINSTEFIDITDKVLEGETKYFKEIKTGFSIEFKSDTNDEYLKQIDDIKKYYTKELKVSYNPIDIDLSSGNFKDLVLYHNILDNNFASFWQKCFYQDDNFHVSPTWKQIIYGEFGNYYSNFKTETSFQSNISQFLNIKLMQPGNSVFHYNTKSEFNLRLCFDSGKKTAPFSNEIVPQADNHTENLHLNFWSEKGLFKTFWKSFTDWYFNIPYELDLKIQLSIADLKRLDFTKKYLINNQLYFIDSIKVVIHLNGTLEPALVRVFPC